MRPSLLSFLVAALLSWHPARAADVDATTLRGKVMCGYQGWFRCPGDGAKLGWVHWSRDSKRIAPDTLTFDMWPDLSDFPANERFPATGFANADGSTAALFSSDNAATVLCHFEWMRDYGIDGAWLQEFVIELPGAPGARRYPTRLNVLRHVAAAAKATGRTWAITYDLTGTPPDRIYDAVTTNWKSLIDDKTITGDARYLRHDGRPVVQVFGFYPAGKSGGISAELANRLIDFFKTPGPYHAFLAGAGAWEWRKNTDPAWQAVYRKLDVYSPWNVGNYAKSTDGTKRASTGYWADDQKEFQRENGRIWMPVIYPGFSWNNLKRQAGQADLPRRGGKFYWEQFHAAAKLKAAAVFVAMFDEVDEGTAIFKVTNAPPTQSKFATYEGLSSDWYLRLTGEATKRLRAGEPFPPEIPIKP